MMCPYAIPKLLQNQIGIDNGMQVPLRMVVHIAQGPTLSSIQNEFETTTEIKAAHFAVGDDGTIWQFVDTDMIAFGVGGRFANLTSIHVENTGFSGSSLSVAQLNSDALLLMWLNQEFGVPFQLSNGTTDSGLGYHAQFGGHPFCPGQPIIDQLPSMLDQAVQYFNDQYVNP